MFASNVSRLLKAALFAGPLVVLALSIVLSSVGRGDTGVGVISLLSTQKTTIDQPISYPVQKPAKVTALLVTVQPGAEVEWHKHPVPLFAYILEGEMTVDYGPHGTKIYRKDDAVMEAIDTAHDGRNTGSVPARILAVFMGAESVKNTIKVARPK